MKSTLRSLWLLAALGTATPAAVAQTPWASANVPWGGPPYDTQNVTMMQLTGPTGIGLLVEGKTQTSHTTYSAVYTSTNEGQTWNSTGLAGHRPGGNGTELLDYSPLDGQVAWAVIGHSGATSPPAPTTSVDLEKTTTGIGGFATIPNPAGLDLLFVRAFSANVAVARVANATGFLRTTDGGQTWAPVVPTPTITGQTKPRTTTLGTSLWIPTTTGDVLYTADQGQTWGAAATGLGASLQGTAFRDALHGLAYGGTQLARTTDGGQTWTPLAFSGLARTTYLAAIPGTPAGYISVGAGLLAYCVIGSTAGTAVSANDGLTWTTVESTESHSIVAAGSPSRAWTNKQNTLSPPICTPNLLSSYVGSLLATRSSAAELVGLYPNPTTGPVQLPTAGTYQQATVYDALGRQCLAQPLAQTASTLNLARLGAGVYAVVLSGLAGRQTSRIVVLP